MNFDSGEQLGAEVPLVCIEVMCILFFQGEQKWKQLAELAIQKCEFGLALECLHQAQDFGGLLLLASSAGNAEMLAKLGDGAEKNGQNNVAFLSYFVLGRYEFYFKLYHAKNRLSCSTHFQRPSATSDHQVR